MTDLLTINDTPGQHPPSWYAATAGALPEHPALDGDRTAHICIVGAGYTGLSAALELSGKGLDVVLLEANRIGWGASGRNGGQLCSGMRKGQLTLRNSLGEDRARLLWDLSQDAKALVRGNIETHHIDCALKSGFVEAELSEAGVRELHEEAEFLARKRGYTQIRPLDRDGIRAEIASEAYQGGIHDAGAGHLHPLRYALGLSRAVAEKGAVIHENTRVLSVSEKAPHKIRTATGTITADRVIFAMNGYHGDVYRPAARRVMPINSLILTTEPLGEDRVAELIPGDVAVADSKFVVNYFRRTADHRILWGGAETYGYRFPGNPGRAVRGNMLKILPQLRDARIDYAWGGTLAITRSRLPFLHIKANTQLFAGGYSGHGLALATLAGHLMARYVLGDKDGFRAFNGLANTNFPGGPRLRQPLLALAMSWFSMRDRFGF